MTCPNPPLQETETICESGHEYLNRLSALARISAPRQASASADAKDTSRSAQANHRPKASTPIEIGLPRRSTPGVGLRQRKRHPPGRRRPTAGRRPPRRLKSAFQGACAPSVSLRRRKRHLSVGAGRPSAEGLPRPNSFGTLRARRRPPPTQKLPLRSAQADRWPKAPGGRIHSARRLTTGRRPSQAEFIRHTWPTVGHRPPQGEFLRRASPARRRAGRPWRGV
jgi:hypothetical protein